MNSVLPPDRMALRKVQIQEDSQDEAGNQREVSVGGGADSGRPAVSIKQEAKKSGPGRDLGPTQRSRRGEVQKPALEPEPQPGSHSNKT